MDRVATGPDRWYAGRGVYDREHRPRHYVLRLAGQPEDGFRSIGEVMDWLARRELIVGREDSEGVIWEGWGDPWCAVAASRDDPWEDDA